MRRKKYVFSDFFRRGLCVIFEKWQRFVLSKLVNVPVPKRRSESPTITIVYKCRHRAYELNTLDNQRFR